MKLQKFIDNFITFYHFDYLKDIGEHSKKETLYKINYMKKNNYCCKIKKEDIERKKKLKC